MSPSHGAQPLSAVRAARRSRGPARRRTPADLRGHHITPAGGRKAAPAPVPPTMQ